MSALLLVQAEASPAEAEVVVLGSFASATSYPVNVYVSEIILKIVQNEQDF